MNTSFAANCKAEICRIIPSKKCCAIAQCFGILLFCNSFSSSTIRIITESNEFAAFLPKLFKKAFSTTFDLIPPENTSGKFIFQISDPVKIHGIMNTYGFDPDDTLALHINFSSIEDDCCRTAFLRGAMLAGGSVSDPAKSYHMEISTIHGFVAREARTLMWEDLGFSPKIATRGGGQVLYLKQSDQISDMLTYLGAPIAAMGIIEAKLEKELNNKVNRRCNCDDANTSKVVEAAQEQLSAIRILKEQGRLEIMPQKLQQAAIAREQHPEASLTELAALMDPPISKPAMNHRLKKLVESAKEAIV